MVYSGRFYENPHRNVLFSKGLYHVNGYAITMPRPAGDSTDHEWSIHRFFLVHLEGLCCHRADVLVWLVIAGVLVDLSHLGAAITIAGTGIDLAPKVRRSISSRSSAVSGIRSARSIVSWLLLLLSGLFHKYL
jgi:hypothetical protein